MVYIDSQIVQSISEYSVSLYVGCRPRLLSKKPSTVDGSLVDFALHFFQADIAPHLVQMNADLFPLFSCQVVIVSVFCEIYSTVGESSDENAG